MKIHSYGFKVLLPLILAVTYISFPASLFAQDRNFVQEACSELNHGIHQKVESYTTEDGFTDMVIYSVFCGVELKAEGSRKLQGEYTQEVGYNVIRHWGFLKYTPSTISIQRKDVEEGRWKMGTWRTLAEGLNNIVVLSESEEIINGSWSHCFKDDYDLCNDD